MRKVYLIPVAYEMYGHVPVTAESPEEALEVAQATTDDLPLPEYGEYVEDTFEIDVNGLVIDTGLAEEEPEKEPSGSTVYEITYSLQNSWGEKQKSLCTRLNGTEEDLTRLLKKMKRSGCVIETITVRKEVLV